jgi:hypothetical protein
MIDIPVIRNPLTYESRSFTLLLMDIIFSECEIYSDIRYPGSYYIDAVEKLREGFFKVNSSDEEWSKFERYENALSNEKIQITREMDYNLCKRFYELYNPFGSITDRVKSLFTSIKILHDEFPFVREMMIYGLIKCIQNFDYIRTQRIYRHYKDIFGKSYSEITVDDYSNLKNIKINI